MLKALIRFKLWAFPSEYADTNGYRYIVVSVCALCDLLALLQILYKPSDILSCLELIILFTFSGLLMVIYSKYIDSLFY